MTDFVKRSRAAQPGFFACEAAGLRWLSEVDGGVPCAQILHVDDESLTLRRLNSAPPSRTAAHDFGFRLAVTHQGGASAFGVGPAGWDGPAYFGPMSKPLPMSTVGHARWGEFYAQERLRPMLDRAAPRLSGWARGLVQSVMERCAAGDFDDDDRPARLHGDLWSGNVMWTPDGLVVIDPAAHGGHRETDLAMLALFGCPYLDEVLTGYQSMRPLRQGWPARVGLHQLYPLLVHVVLFGGSYAAQVEDVARQALLAPG
jgi:fructosamine-3-kinase